MLLLISKINFGEQARTIVVVDIMSQKTLCNSALNDDTQDNSIICCSNEKLRTNLHFEGNCDDRVSLSTRFTKILSSWNDVREQSRPHNTIFSSRLCLIRCEPHTRSTKEIFRHCRCALWECWCLSWSCYVLFSSLPLHGFHHSVVGFFISLFPFRFDVACVRVFFFLCSVYLLLNIWNTMIFLHYQRMPTRKTHFLCRPISLMRNARVSEYSDLDIIKIQVIATR